MGKPDFILPVLQLLSFLFLVNGDQRTEGLHLGEGENFIQLLCVCRPWYNAETEGARVTMCSLLETQQIFLHGKWYYQDMTEPEYSTSLIQLNFGINS